MLQLTTLAQLVPDSHFSSLATAALLAKEPGSELEPLFIFYSLVFVYLKPLEFSLTPL